MEWELELDQPDPVTRDGSSTAPGSVRRRSGSRAGAATATAAAVLLLLGLLGWVGDQDRRSGELDALLGCVAEGQSSVRYAERRVAGMRQYVTPSLGTGLSDRTRQGIFQLVAGAADGALPGLRRASATCREVSVLPWHGDLRMAQQAYLAHLDARIGVTEAISRNGVAPAAQRDRLAGLAGRARGALLAAAGSGSAADRARATATGL